MSICKNHIFSLGIAAVMACGIPAFAQGLNSFVQANKDPLSIAEVDPGQVQENRYRIGLDCGPCTEPLRVHLRLPDDAGLLVNSVMEDSPAGRSGIRRFDVIVEANGRPVGAVAELVQAVNTARDAEMELAIIREGNRQLVKVTPEQRDDEEIQRLRDGFANRLGQGAWPSGMGSFAQAQAELERALQQMQQQFGLNSGWQQIRPGIILDDQNASSSSTSTHVMMHNGQRLSIKVERNGNSPANITVERGNDKWELTENDIAQLPDDIRPLVENHLNGHPGFHQRWIAPNRGFFRGNGQVPDGVVPPRADRQQDDRVQKRFDGLELRMKELQDAIKSIQGGN